MLSTERVGDLYPIHSTNIAYLAADQERLKQLHLFHQRCGHMGSDALRRLLNNDALVGKDVSALKSAFGTSRTPIHMVDCEGCALGKSHRQPFKSHSSKPVATELLERIYCDLSGRVQLKDLTPQELEIFETLGSPEYVSGIVDEKSRYVIGKLLQTKDETSDHIIPWITQAENY